MSTKFKSNTKTLSFFKNNLTKLFALCVISFNSFIVTAQDFRILSQMPIDNNSCAATLQYDRNDYGIGILNNKGAMTKEEKFKFSPNDMGIMGDNILLIADQLKNNIKTIGYNAMLFNKKTLNIVAEQQVYTKKNSSRISSTLLKDPFNNLCYALFRETKYDEGFGFFGPSINDTKFLESESLQLVSFNNKLETKPIEIKTEASNSYFADACADAAKNIYICSFTNNSIMVEKFDSTGKLLTKLSSAFSVWKNPFFGIIMHADFDNQSCISIATLCKNEDKKMAHNLFRFDFANNKVMRAGEVIFNKTYRELLKNPNEEAKGNNFSSFEDMKITQMLQDTNKLIVVKEIRYEEAGGKGEATTNYRRGCIITVYNKKSLQVERDIVIDKKFASFVEQSEGISAHLVGNNLYAVTCENTGLASFKTFVNKINITTGEVIKTEIEKEDIGKGMVTFPTQVAWFKNNYVVPFFKVASVFSYRFESAFVLSPY